MAIVVDFNTFDEASRLTQQLMRGQAGSFSLSVVHVDNGAAKPVQLTQESKDLGVQLLRLEKNEGYAAGLVECINKNPNYDAYWFLNSDLEVDSDTLAKLVNVLDEDSHVGAVGPRVFKGRTSQVWGSRGVVNVMMGTTAMTDWPQSGALPRWSYIPGCSLLVRKTAYDEVGGLPLEYRMYFEETELCVRLQKAGWELYVDVSASAYHSVKSMEKGIPARHYAYYFARNNLHFWNKNFAIPWPLQFPRMGCVVLKELIAPLRRAKNMKELEDRLIYIGAGVLDSIPFVNGKARFDHKLFPR